MPGCISPMSFLLSYWSELYLYSPAINRNHWAVVPSKIRVFQENLKFPPLRQTVSQKRIITVGKIDLAKEIQNAIEIDFLFADFEYCSKVIRANS